jgi:hypothetical protein
VAENTVLKEVLTDEMVEAGARLVRKLDELAIPVTAAFWMLDTEINEWRLFLACPLVQRDGPPAVYEMIYRAIAQLDERTTQVLFMAISVAPDEELIEALRATLRTEADVERIRFRRNVAGGHFIEDALIYRSR